ncbi:MAG: hypothetical protein CMH26_08930 [Micavibrio sp.]|nr:hypothetical protein [Micavibrio sp.]|tara:strand:- start:475 stop:807 length:333 start_codon:yes stop_codon:yes gene_type:complete
MSNEKFYLEIEFKDASDVASIERAQAYLIDKMEQAEYKDVAAIPYSNIQDRSVSIQDRSVSFALTATLPEGEIIKVLNKINHDIIEDNPANNGIIISRDQNHFLSMSVPS